MKILMVIPYLGSTYGGTSKVVTDLVHKLGNLGISVDLVTTNANGSETLDIPLNIWISQQYYRVKYFSCWHRNDFVISPSLIGWLFNHAVDYNLVHTHTIFSPLISVVHWICQFHNIPYITTPHGMLEPWALSYKAWKKRLYFSTLEKPALQKARAIQVLASSEAKNINALGFEHTIVIPNGIHSQEFQELPDPEQFYQQFPATRNKTLILFLGRIDPKKGLDLLATAFAQIHNQFPHTHLVVAGPDSIGFLPTVKSYFSQAGCLEAVTFTGMLKDSLKNAALTAANLYVAPSYSEGFSMSVLEAMASGLPCVMTTGCNFPEAAAAKVARVVDIDAESIAKALITCLAHRKEAKAMGDRARQFILQNYTWDIAAKKLIQVYSDILNTKATSEEYTQTI
jgi:glycosyltransferase involved in cell wall biosynthesis